MSMAIAPALVRPRGPLWSPGELRDLVTAVPPDDVLAQARFASPQRWWARLALTDEVEVWALSWLPGQHTRPHDHGGASGAFTVVLGAVSETYRYPGGDVRQRIHHRGSAIGFGPGRAHQVWNTATEKAVTVHAYSPPLVPTRDYESLWDVPSPPSRPSPVLVLP